MNKSYNLMEGVLNTIEKSLKENINLDTLAGHYDLSTRHLNRIFKHVFNVNLGAYIRSRKLTSSLNDLLKSNENILSIGLSYNFEYEQTYIRSFKREFGITPGELRKTKQIVEVKPPLHLNDIII